MTIMSKLHRMKEFGIAVTATAFLVAAPPSLAQPAMAVGRVIKVDETVAKITIKHGPLKQFEMEEPMTMVYRASDPAMLKAVKAGDKIRFTADRVNGQFTVTTIEKMK
jgi:Cu(I)/Ag(I) efflux system periplasmic protein CusF